MMPTIPPKETDYPAKVHVDPESGLATNGPKQAPLEEQEVLRKRRDSLELDRLKERWTQENSP